MSRATKMQTSFNGGEFSPRMFGRVDQAVYEIGVAECENFVPVIQGPVVKRSGTIYVETPKAQCRLIPFVPFTTQGYVIEASAAAFRFYTNNSRIETAPGVAYQVTTPWTWAQLNVLDVQPSVDVLYLVHGQTSPRVLARTGAETFALSELVLKNGPFDDDNTDETLTVTADGTTGSITITSSGPLFVAGHVGGLMRLEAQDFAAITAWEPGYNGVIVGALRRSEAKVYYAATAGRSGTVQPIHTQGAEWDGVVVGKDINDKDAGGILWQYRHDKYGIVKITGYTSPTQVTAEVVRRLPDSLTSTASWRWALGAFSTANGWPSAVTIWNERLVLAKDATLYGSTVGGYDDFGERNSAGELTSDRAFRVPLPDPNPILWLAADQELLIGAANAEYKATRIQGEARPDIKRQSKYGSGQAKPCEAGSRMLFVQKAGRKVREIDYNYQRDRYQAPDLTVVAEHLGKRKILGLTYQQEPDSLVWAWRADGLLLSLTYSPEEQVKGWARHPLGGDTLVEWATCIPDPDGDRDQLWLATRRGGKRAIVRMAPLWEVGDSRNEAFFVDCGLSYQGPTAQMISGLGHLEGETVKILADGSPHPDRIVEGGAITLAESRASTVVHIGRGYSGRLKTLAIEAGGQDGTAQGKRKRIISVVLRMLETLGVSIGVQGLPSQPIEHRLSLDAMNRAVPLFTGDHEINTIGQHERFGQIEISSDQPLPACLLATIPVLETAPR
ncbi:hypothetical protein [Sphingomonas sp. KC8]|uniref:hypothetical protein n=1 Tax=Sphingomonas sp. KC8 TaxID=1030157 RepID=UPI0002FAAE67|nr:hypothetical protein [Sphingomonas sp. KC8]ARS27614.1 hypothetical protein KC8_09950 [Sphingomonas sp. KC8]